MVGAGFSGIGVTVRLKQAGLDDLVVYERSTSVGGVWRDNTYPGAACDVPSHLYSFSFAPEGRWSNRFAQQHEIVAYLERVAVEFDVVRHVRFSSEVESAVYDESCLVWTLRLADGTTGEYDVVITACGQLSRPAVPDVPGLQEFAGAVFHSAQWDHDADLSGRVAVLGTGASAIQFVPEVARQAAAMTVFQRSAPYVVRKPDRAYGPGTKAALERFPLLLKADRLRTFVTNEARSLGFNTEPRLMKGHQIRFSRQLSRSVPEPDLRARLTPSDPIGCKRILQSNDWYPALRQPHVRLVTEGVTAVEQTGVRTIDGELHVADVLVLGTGFTATELIAPMEVVGRGGRTLREAWAGGAEAHLGTLVNGFPNLFLLYGPNTNLGHNSIVLMLESQFRYVLDALDQLAPGTAVEVRDDVQRAFNDDLQRRLGGTVFAGGCRSWYLTADGRNTQNWPGTTVEFRLRTRRVRPSDVVVHRLQASA